MNNSHVVSRFPVISAPDNNPLNRLVVDFCKDERGRCGELRVNGFKYCQLHLHEIAFEVNRAR